MCIYDNCMLYPLFEHERWKSLSMGQDNSNGIIMFAFFPLRLSQLTWPHAFHNLFNGSVSCYVILDFTQARLIFIFQQQQQHLKLMLMLPRFGAWTLQILWMMMWTWLMKMIFLMKTIWKSQTLPLLKVVFRKKSTNTLFGLPNT